ncbi:hypothetical protein HOG17_01995 [Candidatus Peregrinibacteria bacterium]|jgi:hypothetical protein|nr:hypothetical protein [Candidatus Peregrinibacteria bacterium]MBT4147796.1 hypothetical protein [Candidatus Peregrinibacteria bacterium]MBT4366311.1 hypothetical protein [Candidatus Peregrinibacteria bacterium]MBT4456518.1 hypothetical protein [Candidatus Peregrinibacteria bacterium]
MNEILEGVSFEPLSPRQKPACINNSAEHKCDNPATQEAVHGINRVRCCDEDPCKIRAATLAKISKELQ